MAQERWSAKVRQRALLALGAAAILTPALAVRPSIAQTAQENPADSVWTRPALFDVPGGPKQQLRDKGISIEVKWTQFQQGIFSGSGRSGWQYGGRGDLLMTVDGEKLGLWKGLALNLHQEAQYGRDANALGDGSLIPINTALAFPRLGGSDFNTSLTVTQSFGNAGSISVGKFNMFDAAAKTPLMGGGGLDTFMNLGLAAPLSGVTPPYILGTIATLRTDPVIFTAMIYDPRNAQNQDVLQHPFSKGTTMSLAVTVPTKLAGLQGYIGLRGVYSSKSGFNLDDISALILPPESRGALIKTGYWYGQASFQQYLYQDPDNPASGWGLFGELALSDGNPNAIRGHGIIGIGGNAPFAGRSLDRWGVAYFKYKLSESLLEGLSQFNLVRQDEQGMEVFYNYAITPWLRVTANLQWVDPFEPQKKNAWIGALRTQVRF